MVPTDDELDRAEARGRGMAANDPRASAVRFEQETGRVVLELSNGCGYAFPAKLVQDLQGAGAGDLMEVVIDGAGFNLHWPTLDVDLYVPALVAGLFGTQAWMSRGFPGRAGSTRSRAKAAGERPAVREKVRSRKPATL